MILDLHDPALDEYREEARKFAEAFAAQNLEQGFRDLSTPEGLAKAREMIGFRDLIEAGEAGDVKAEDRVVEADGASVPVRIFRPEGTARGVYLDIHGGGFFLGSASMGDTRNARCAQTLGLAVVSVEYRLAPEHPWPAGPDDCETAARWLLDAAEREFGAERLAVGGASAGANLAAALLLRVRDKLDAADRFVGANLVYGPYDLSGLSPSGRIHAPASDLFRPLYMGHVDKAERVNPDISPLFADLHGLPPALFTVGELDGLYEDNLAMAIRWAAAGNESELDVYPDSPHAFDVFPTQMAEAARQTTLAWLGARFD
jgi:acetyl esterase/lipase